MRCLFKIISLIVFVTIIGVAQSPEGFMEGKRRPSERLESYKKVRMIETLKLDEETGLKLVNRYNEHRKIVKQLDEDRKGVMDKLESQVQSSIADAELQKTFNELFDIERKIMDSRKKYLENLKEIFSTKQIAEYIIFERNFMKDLRNVVNDVQKQRMRRD
ncbi:MAG: hypothetical protein Q8L88_08705 [Bacteroidota bacterium]|nr:hypothetical protein [Bacteroidota bacterium]